MYRSPAESPYAQPIPVVMNYLLCKAYPRFEIAAGWLEYVDSSVDPTRPDRAVARYRATDGCDETIFSRDYTRMDLNRYGDLATPDKRAVPWGDAPIEAEAVQAYILENFHVWLELTDFTMEVSDTPDATGAVALTITPTPNHPVWHGQLLLSIVPADDIRTIIWKLSYPLLNPTTAELP